MRLLLASDSAKFSLAAIGASKGIGLPVYPKSLTGKSLGDKFVHISVSENHD